MRSTQSSGWYFIDSLGTFELLNPQNNSYLYFPLVNQAGMMSSITPMLNGDAKTGQNEFLLLPVSVEDLHNSRSGRNFWVSINGVPWSVTGNSAAQISQGQQERDDTVKLQAGFLWHCIQRQHLESGLSASITNFIPIGEDTLELMHVTLTNHGLQALELTSTVAIPIYGRSADNLRDHRHVTSLLHRTTCHKYGVLVKPSMSFDERGHTYNQTTYAVLGFDGGGNPPTGFSPIIEDFIGEGGSLVWPKTIIENNADIQAASCTFEGFESLGGLHFPGVCLQPGETQTYSVLLSILNDGQNVDALVDRYNSQIKVETHLEKTKDFWRDKLSVLQFKTGDARYDGWLQWVTLQPILRRIMGNSFLPYHDYGRGGRGWRDLWQDLLALILTQGSEVGKSILDNFAGVRMDGSNATIVGTRLGEFKADRNSIPRVWMDHGAWPLLTTSLYLDVTGDLGLLLENQTYFKDHLTHRCQKEDGRWAPSQGTLLKSESGDTIQGTILEHLLVQHLTAFYNVGEHNIIRLEGGDWNDGLDMASERGESVAFSAMYAGNLRILNHLCTALMDAGFVDTTIASELMPLLDRISAPLDYGSVAAKQSRLQDYFNSLSGAISGNSQRVPLTELASDLLEKADWLANHIREQEWVTDQKGLSWFNGYYDNQGQRVEGAQPDGIRMTLTGQVFPLMAGIASHVQVQQIIRSADYYLYDAHLLGYRLNTNFGRHVPQLGRAFSFAYGHKENGAVFSHMAVMFAYALYQQGMAQEAWRILDGLYTQSQDFSASRIYPGIPEYFNPRGRGMYPYLTGSAAWYLFTLLTESYGVKGSLGDLLLAPKLVAEQFAHVDQLRVQTAFAGKSLEVIFINPKHLSYGKYKIKKIIVNGQEHHLLPGAVTAQFARRDVLAWTDPVNIIIYLD